MFSISFNWTLHASKDAIVASTATFVLTCMFFVMAFMLLPAVRG